MAAPDPVQAALLAAEPDSAVTRRSVVYGALGMLVAAAAGTRLAGFGGMPARSAAPGLGDERVTHALVADLASLEPDAAASALAGPAFDAAERARLAPLLRDREAHLVGAPFFGVGGSVGQAVIVDCGLLRRRIVLGAAPQTVLLPIGRAGRIVVTAANGPAGNGAPGNVTMGLVVMSGPTALPPLQAGGSIVLDVIVA